MKAKILFVVFCLISSAVLANGKADPCFDFQPESGPIVLPLCDQTNLEVYLMQGTYVGRYQGGWIRLVPLNSNQTQFQVQWISSKSCDSQEMGTAVLQDGHLQFKDRSK